MTGLQVINTGAFPNDATGDPVQTAFIKCNENFATLNIPNLEIDSLLTTFNVPLGLVLDGVTDNTAVIQTALNSHLIVTLPAGLIFMASGITVPAGVTLQGMGAVQTRPDQGFATTGTVLLFGASVATCVSLSSGTPADASAVLQNLVIGRQGAAASAPTTSVGILFNNSAMVRMYNVLSRNHGSLYKFLGTAGGIHCEMYGCGGDQQTLYGFNINEWPELYVFGGRFGSWSDGVSSAFVYLTGPSGGSGGVGPNTITFTGSHFNGNGVGAEPNYWVLFDNVQVAQPSQVEFKFIGCHVESIALGYIASTSTAPYIQYLQLDSCNLHAGVDLLSQLNSVTQLNQLYLSNNVINGPVTLAQAALVNHIAIVNCDIAGAVSLTGNASFQNNLKLLDTFIDSSLTLAGTWNDLYVKAVSASGGLTNTVTNYQASSTIEIDVQGNGIKTTNPIPQWVIGTNPAAATWQTQTARGTLGSPTATQLNDQALRLLGTGYTGSGYATMAGIRFQAAGNFTGSSAAGEIIFSATQSGSTSPTDYLVLQNTGALAPVTDNTISSGAVAQRWTVTYSVSVIATNFTCGTGGCGFFGAIQEAQPTTAGPTSTFVANSGTAINSASTFDGYTLTQVVKGLRTLGLLA